MTSYDTHSASVIRDAHTDGHRVVALIGGTPDSGTDEWTLCQNRGDDIDDLCEGVLHRVFPDPCGGGALPDRKGDRW